MAGLCRERGGVMAVSFDLEKLDVLLKDFYTLTQIRISVFDNSFQELTAYPKELTGVCQIIRSDMKGLENCMACDRQGCEIAARGTTAYTYTCHAGFTESILPIYSGNVVIGYLFFGHVFDYPSHEEGFREISARCKDYKLDREALYRECMAQPLIQKDFIESAANIMKAVALYLNMEQMAVHHNSLEAQVDEYLSAHYTEDITAADICNALQIGKTKLYEIAKQNYGRGIAEQIRVLRIEKAKKMLRDRNQSSVAEVASACGFSDYNYFITVFKRLTGVTPKKYASQ